MMICSDGLMQDALEDTQVKSQAESPKKELALSRQVVVFPPKLPPKLVFFQ